MASLPKWEESLRNFPLSEVLSDICLLYKKEKWVSSQHSVQMFLYLYMSTVGLLVGALFSVLALSVEYPD